MADDEEPKDNSDEAGPPKPKIYKKCFKVDGQLYYGDVKLKKTPGDASEADAAGADDANDDPNNPPGAGPHEYTRHGEGLTIWIKKVDNSTGESSSESSDAESNPIKWKQHEGTWVDDKMTGYCKITYFDGSSYSGYVEDGKFHGKGIFRFGTDYGSYYDGNWEYNEMHGPGGEYQGSLSGDYFQGEFHRNCINKAGRWVDVLDSRKREEMRSILSIEESSEGPVTGGGNNISGNGDVNMTAATGTGSALTSSKSKKDSEFLPIVDVSHPSNLLIEMEKMIKEKNLVPLLVVDSSLSNGGFDIATDWLKTLAELKRGKNEEKMLNEHYKKIEEIKRIAAEKRAAEAEEAGENGGGEEGGQDATDDIDETPPDLTTTRPWEDSVHTMPTRVISIGQLATIKRRKYDYQSKMFNGIRTAFLGNDIFCLVYDKYDDKEVPLPLGAEVYKNNGTDAEAAQPPDSGAVNNGGNTNGDLNDDDAIAAPSALARSVMGRALEIEQNSRKETLLKCSPAPTEWKLSEFYDDRCLPVGLFDPKSFLMEQNVSLDFVKDYEKTKILKGKEEEEAAKAKAAADAEANEENGGEGEDGSSGSMVKLPDSAVKTMGIDVNGKEIKSSKMYNMMFCIVINEPVVTSASETRDRDVRKQLQERFANHFPLKKTGVIRCVAC